jgi:hypothetical protein
MLFTDQCQDAIRMLGSRHSRCLISSAYVRELVYVPELKCKVLRCAHEEAKRLVGSQNWQGDTLLAGMHVGGGAALIAAVMLKALNPYMKITVVSFNAPRVGDEAFCRLARGSCVHVRLRAGTDMLPEATYGMGLKFDVRSTAIGSMSCGDVLYARVLAIIDNVSPITHREMMRRLGDVEDDFVDIEYCC